MLQKLSILCYAMLIFIITNASAEDKIISPKSWSFPNVIEYASGVVT